MLLLDTSLLVELEHELDTPGIGPVQRFLGTARRQPFGCSVVSVGELAAGSAEHKVRFLLRNVRKLPINESLAYRAALLERELSQRGKRLGENDNWIAATALTYSATLVYCDGDFERVPGLKRRFVDVTG